MALAGVPITGSSLYVPSLPRLSYEMQSECYHYITGTQRETNSVFLVCEGTGDPDSTNIRPMGLAFAVSQRAVLTVCECAGYSYGPLVLVRSLKRTVVDDTEVKICDMTILVAVRTSVDIGTWMLMERTDGELFSESNVIPIADRPPHQEERIKMYHAPATLFTFSRKGNPLDVVQPCAVEVRVSMVSTDSFYHHSAPFEGSVGAPVLLMDGRAVGMHFETNIYDDNDAGKVAVSTVLTLCAYPDLLAAIARYS